MTARIIQIRGKETSTYAIEYGGEIREHFDFLTLAMICCIKNYIPFEWVQ